MSTAQNEVVSQIKSFPAKVWGTLSRIDVGDHIETKGDKFKLSYLSWSWAWAQLMNHYPESDFEVLKPKKHPDETLTVRVSVTVRQGDNALKRTMWLPVMDHRNVSIPNPTSRNVSDSTMRCLVKCLALFGLGLDVYAKSDMPVGAWEDPISEEQAELITSLLEKSEADVQKFLEWLGAETIESIPANKYKIARSQLERKIKAVSK